MKNLFILLTLSLTLGTAAADGYSLDCCDDTMGGRNYGEMCWCSD